MPSLGLVGVPVATMRIRAMSTSSSSAAIWASAVTMPWPISTLPGLSCTKPSRLNLQPAATAADWRQAWAAARPPWSRSCPGLLGRAQHRAHDAVVRPAPTEVAVERRAHVRVARIGIAPQQGGGRDQDAGQAVAALARLLGDEGPLQRMRPLRRAEALDRDDVLARCRPQRRVAGGDRLPRRSARCRRRTDWRRSRNCVPVRPSCPRSTPSSDVAGSASTVRSAPFTRNLIGSAIASLTAP